MRVVKDIQTADVEEPEATVVTGDGNAERRRIEALAQHFDGPDVLHFPSGSVGEIHGSSPVRYVGTKKHNRTDVNHTGKAVLDGIEPLVPPYTEFVFVIDREHFSEHPESDLESKADELTDGRCQVSSLAGEAYEIEFEIGPYDVTVHAAVVGEQYSCFEDSLVSLADQLGYCGEKAVYNAVSSKDELKQKLDDEIGTTGDEELINDAARGQIDHCFPNIAAVFRQFE
jgi:hypothetical protein